MEFKTQLIGIKEITTKIKSEINKSAKAVMYNKITSGKFKNWTAIQFLIPPEGESMSIWTKDQKNYLDKEFAGVNNRIDGLDKRIDNLEHTMINIFKLNGFKVK